MAISKIILNGVTQIDLTSDTVVANNLIAPNTAHGADGEAIVGTASGGGSSSWTKIAETSYQVSTTSTSAADVAILETGHSEIWTSDKIVYVRIRDTAGKRTGYFYGSDNFFINPYLKNGSTVTSMTYGTRFYIRYSTNYQFMLSMEYGANGYGVYANMLYSDGRVKIRSRYNSSNSLTIDGTYKVEVYLLDPAGGVPIFE